MNDSCISRGVVHVFYCCTVVVFAVGIINNNSSNNTTNKFLSAPLLLRAEDIYNAYKISETKVE